MSIAPTVPGIESLTLVVTQEIQVRATVKDTFRALLEQIGPVPRLEMRSHYKSLPVRVARKQVARKHIINLPHYARSAYCTEAAINLSVSGLPLGVPNQSAAVLMCIAVRIAAMIATARFPPSSIWQ
jgi:hypothetical protein